jgi:hypothetical protein
MVTRGLGVEDLPEVYREEYMHAVEIAKAIHDPGSDWDNFVEALWLALVPAFGLDVKVVHRRGASGARPQSRDARPPGA